MKENSLTYAISFNGKARFSMELPADMPREEIEKAALAHENSEIISWELPRRQNIEAEDI